MTFRFEWKLKGLTKRQKLSLAGTVQMSAVCSNISSESGGGLAANLLNS